MEQVKTFTHPKGWVKRVSWSWHLTVSENTEPHKRDKMNNTRHTRKVCNKVRVSRYEDEWKMITVASKCVHVLPHSLMQEMNGINETSLMLTRVRNFYLAEFLVGRVLLLGWYDVLHDDGNAVEFVAYVITQLLNVANDDKLHLSAASHERHTSDFLDDLRRRLTMRHRAVLDVPKYCRKEWVISEQILSN